MSVGSVIRLVWDFVNPAASAVFLVPAAAGVIAGGGLWAVPEAVLALAKANAPICMQFVATSAVKKTTTSG